MALGFKLSIFPPKNQKFRSTYGITDTYGLCRGCGFGIHSLKGRVEFGEGMDAGYWHKRCLHTFQAHPERRTETGKKLARKYRHKDTSIIGPY